MAPNYHAMSKAELLEVLLTLTGEHCASDSVLPIDDAALESSTDSKLVSHLKTHQIELEMQNRELRES